MAAKRLASALVMASVGALASGPASAAAGNMKLTLAGGFNFIVDGDLFNNTVATINESNRTSPALEFETRNLEIEQGPEWGDAFGPVAEAAVEVAYGLTDAFEVFGSFGYAHASGSTILIGTTQVDSQPGMELPTFAQVSNYTAYMLEGGARYYFDTGIKLRPYVAGRAGAAFVDDMKATITVPDAGIHIDGLAIYDNSLVFTGGVDLGLAYQIGEKVSMSVETGLRYFANLDNDDRDTEIVDFTALNDNGRYVAYPVRARLSREF